MTLNELIDPSAPPAESWGSFDQPIKALHYNSGSVGPGDLFFALRGTKVDGHRFIGRAIEAGASAIVAEEAPGSGAEGVTWLRVENTRAAMGPMAARFYGEPSLDLKVAGVTGTNGKTTTTFLLRHLMEAAQRKCGLIGTVHYDTGEVVSPAPHTTPESSDLHALLAEMREASCRAAVMEVSSHGLVQHRPGGVEFDVAVFTNLSQDHLDYHGDMASYYAAKKLLFTNMAAQRIKTGGIAVVNGDDRWGEQLLREIGGGVSFGFGARNDFRAENYQCSFEGSTMQLTVKGHQFLVRSPLIGRFNAYNVLAALAAAVAMGANRREAVAHLKQAPQVPGRMESVEEGVGFRVFVDYAHTPDAVEKACATLRELKPRRLITVFGCGGDRDRTKRPLMARAAARGSDFVILTSDNPRTEDPEQILADTEKGLEAASYEKIPDRREAIARAVDLAEDRDIVLIAGKGHEDYQLVGGERLDFDDRVVARWCINDRRNSE